MEYRVLHRDGAVVWIHDEAVRIDDDDGRPLYWQGVMLDITAQRMADAAVHGLAESLRGIFAASPLPITVLNRDATVRHWNPSAERLFGWTEAEVVGRALPQVPADASPAFDELLARATAGECGLPFFNVRIEEILDPFLGRSERNLHDVFEHARANAPCVLFLDELDALAFSRRRHVGNAARPLVDMLLQELDAIGAGTENLLVLAATNVPWDVDEGLKRPGRFDRLVFVPPPDEQARRRILEIHLAGRPAAALDLGALARRTPLFSGADLRALVERAVDAVIDEALEAGEERPVAMGHLERALAALRPSTIEWLATARNYVEFANHGGRYDDVAAFLRTREAKALR
jgi:hypothetical protein